jgi:hypothetical protein
MVFLIHYDRLVGKLLKFERFSDDQRGHAETTRLNLELSGLSPSTEVVLLEADDEDTLRRTHRRYFETASAIIGG